MKPYYEADGITIYHGDCREVLPSLTEHVDVLLTDPPYGIDYRSMRGSLAIQGDGQTEAPPLIQTCFSLLPSIPPAAYAFCDWRSIGMVGDAMASAGMQPKACIVWDKGHGVQNLDRFAKAHEFILYAGPFGGKRTRTTDVWSCPRDYKPDHPTPKPVSILIRALDCVDAIAGQLVLDPFMGSGSTLRAAKDLGMRAIGIEVEERYCEIAAKRLAQGVLDLDGAA